MTVKEIFELRKQGRLEEAYEAIRPMYAAAPRPLPSSNLYRTLIEPLSRERPKQGGGNVKKTLKQIINGKQ